MPFDSQFYPGFSRGQMFFSARPPQVATAYETASKRRVPPPAFGPLPGEP